MRGARRAREDCSVEQGAPEEARCATSSRPTPKTFGDERRSPIVERGGRAKALDETRADAVRAGHRGAVEEGLGTRRQGSRRRPARLSLQAPATSSCRLRAGAATSGGVPRLDRAHLRLPAHTLPSARGQGEPLSGRLNPPAGAALRGVVMGGRRRLCCWPAMPGTASSPAWAICSRKQDGQGGADGARRPPGAAARAVADPERWPGRRSNQGGHAGVSGRRAAPSWRAARATRSSTSPRSALQERRRGDDRRRRRSPRTPPSASTPAASTSTSPRPTSTPTTANAPSAAASCREVTRGWSGWRW